MAKIHFAALADLAAFDLEDRITEGREDFVHRIDQHVAVGREDARLDLRMTAMGHERRSRWPPPTSGLRSESGRSRPRGIVQKAAKPPRIRHAPPGSQRRDQDPVTCPDPRSAHTAERELLSCKHDVRRYVRNPSPF